MGLRTFNVKFPEKCYDETWAAVAVANHIGSEHQTLLMDLNRGTWENITNLLRYAGRPLPTRRFLPQTITRLL